MRSLSRVIWSEGMHLSQHHFQVQSAYLEDVAAVTLSGLFHAPYGLIACEFDDEALLNGTAAISTARGIMPDGLPFSFPGEPAPAPVRIGELLSPTQAAHLLLLAVPAHRPGRANCAVNGDEAASLRFSATERIVPDELTGADERPVLIARTNFRLLLDNEPAEGLVTMPIARVQRDGAGHLVYDYSYIGPSLRLAANRRLIELTARMVDMLEARADSVRATRSSTADFDYAPREIAGFWFVHALNSAIPALRHALRAGAAHPEQLYLQLAQLAGALCTFSVGSNARDVPLYNHDAPEACFNALERQIGQHLDVILPSAALIITVKPAVVDADGALTVSAVGSTSFFFAKASDPRCFDPSANWFLGLRSAASGADIPGRAGNLVKVCSSLGMAKLVERAYSGLSLQYIAKPPAELSPRPGMHYFLLQRTKPCWKLIVDTGEVGLYIPATIPDPEIELKVVLDKRR